MHERQQVSSKPALVRMAHQNLLRILCVDRNLTSAAVIASTTKRAVETNFIAAAVNIERDATLGRRLFERCVRLELIDVHITSPWLDKRRKFSPMLPLLPDG